MSPLEGCSSRGPPDERRHGKDESAPDDPGARKSDRTLAVALHCTFCHADLARTESVFCATCLAPHHVDCFRGHGTCSAPGCNERAIVRAHGQSASSLMVFTLIVLASVVSVGALSLTSRASSEGAAAIVEPLVVLTPSRRDVTDKVVVPAVVKPYREALLAPSSSGVVASVSVERGDRVAARALVAEVTALDPQDEERVSRSRFTVAEAGVRAAESAVTRAEASVLTAQANVDRASARRELEAVLLRESRGLPSAPDITTAAEARMREAEESSAAARAGLERARADVTSAKKGLDHARLTSTSARLELEALRQRVSRDELRAPFAGVVLERFVGPGALVQGEGGASPATPIIHIADDDRVRISCELSPAERTPVVPGQRLVYSPVARAGEVFECVISAVSSTHRGPTGVEIQAVLENADHRLLIGMTGNATIVLGRRAGALTLPLEAVHNEGGTSTVLLLEGARVLSREVSLGIVEGSLVEITSGLSDNELVVVSRPTSH